MYLVTTKRQGYVLFATTPSERGAVGLTDQQVVHLLVRGAVGDTWRVVAQWNASSYSHTDFMAALHRVDEPADPQGLLAFVPSSVRQ
jgi:hypothetical protein